MPVQLSRRPLGAGRQLTVSGVVTARDLKLGLLSVGRDGGWHEPLLWDFRDAVGLDISPTDLTDIVSFIERHTSHLRPRGRVAVVTTLPEVTATAIAYRSLHQPAARRKIKVVDTMEDADAWLDSSEASAALTPRAMRVALRNAIATLDGDASQIVNMSRTGALLVTPASAAPGDERYLSLRIGTEAIDLRVRVVSAEPEPTIEGSRAGSPPPRAGGHPKVGPYQRYWQVAVMFIDSEAAVDQLRLMVGAPHA